jgi:hypothetical protein
MNESDTVFSSSDAGRPGSNSGMAQTMRTHSASNDIDDRITELEVENSRLNRLVAELLIKNQQLRKQE